MGYDIVNFRKQDRNIPHGGEEMEVKKDERPNSEIFSDRNHTVDDSSTGFL